MNAFSANRVLPVVVCGVVCGLTIGFRTVRADSGQTSMVDHRDATGIVRTISTLPAIDTANPFFMPQGTNGRACASCHQASDAWGVSALHIRQRFVDSHGTDPIFRPVDGANCPDADVSTLGARVRAYSLLLHKGVIRIGLPLPANAEFSIVGVDDPHGCAFRDGIVSVYRRPLPATNLRFQTALMWDGRETRDTLVNGLLSQARDAIMTHEQGSAPPDDVQQQIVAMEQSFYSAQIDDNLAGPLDGHGASGGPGPVLNQPFYAGINDVLGGDPTGAAFDPKVFTAFEAWAEADMDAHGRAPEAVFGRGAALFDVLGALRRHDAAADRRASIARGEAIFDGRAFSITGVAGLNDKIGVAAIPGTCSSCHDTPTVGNHSAKLPINIGVSDASRRTPDLPLFTLRNNVTGDTVQTSDPGLALISGKWADIGKLKGPMLRALSARAPYFHNGSATTLLDVVNFYDQRFQIGFTAREKADLVAFLSSL